MRIRKHASKLLQWSPPGQPNNLLLSGPAPAEPDPVCHLNRSPWDVSPSSLHDYLRHQVEYEDDEGLGFDGIKISDEVDEGNGQNRKKASRRKKIIDSGGSVCKKSDGKGWHCKREAKRPFSLCEYHLKQVRAYYHGGANVVQVQPELDSNSKTQKAVSKGKKKVKKRATPNGLEFYYYYSGFGPWRAKRRGVESAPTVNKSSDNDDEVRPIGEVDDSSEDSEVDEAKRKKGRKPIKARSLKSLL